MSDPRGPYWMQHLMEVFADPARYGYIECAWCAGYGSSLREEAERCTRCGGVGVVPRQLPERVE